jgi:HEAT repeat protein
MKRRSIVFLLLVVVVIVAGVAVAIPASPVFLPKWFHLPPEYDGHPASFWIRELDSPEIEARRKAARALANLGSLSEESIPSLCKALTEDEDRGTRVEASLVMTRMNAKSPALAAAVPALVQALEDKEPAVRINAAMTLMKLETAARPAIPALLRAVKDKANDTNAGLHHFTVQEMAAMALGKASAGTDVAVPALRELLAEAKSDSGRLARIRALGFVGPDARPALPELRALLINPGALVTAAGTSACAQSRLRVPQLREAAEDAIRNIEGV